MLSLRRYRQALIWFLLLAGLAGADPVWDCLQQARPGLARPKVKTASPLQLALIAQAEGESGQAWQLIRQLEKSYQPGTQPAEFFWVRGLLLRGESWDLSQKNLAGVLQRPCTRELRLAALSMLAQGAAEQHLDGESQQYWSEATAQASLLPPGSVAPHVRLALVQANLHLLHAQPAHALSSLLTARALAQQARLPALSALVELKIAEVEMELADWQAFPNTCLRALEDARECPEPWLVEKICGFWVEQQLARRSEPRAVSQCVNALDMASGWFEGSARLAVLRSLARARTVGLNQRREGLALLDTALGQCPAGRLRVRLLLERLNQTPREERRPVIERLLRDFPALGPLEPEDPLVRALPRQGLWAALAETYLPEQPQRAEQIFERARAEAATPAARLEVANYELMRYNSSGALGPARQAMGRLLELARAAPPDAETSRLIRSQMFALRNEARQMTRLLMSDEIRPAPESPALLVLSELLREETLQARLEREIYERIRRAQNYKEALEAYMARAELLMAQSRWGEAVLALERMQQSARQGGWPLREAAASRMLADACWMLGRPERAVESISAAERLYATSPNSRDQRAAVDCRLLRAYFLLRSQRLEEAQAICLANSGPWFTFLQARCLLAAGRNEAARQTLAGFRFDEGPPEVGRLVFLARCTAEAGPLYQQAYERAQRLGSLSVRDVCLEWAAWLRQRGQEAPALALESRTAERVLALLAEYPLEVRERLLDLPATQKLLKSSRPTAGPGAEAPRESRRSFLARLNEIRQRYPGLDSVLTVSPTDLAALQESLPGNRVLVEYFSADTDLYAMRVDSEGCRVVQVAVEKAVLQSWVEQLRGALSRGRELPSGSAQQLYLSLVACLGPGLEGKQVQVIPNGFFWYLPWDVLQDDQGRYLVETQEWSCVAASELMRWGFRPRPPLELERAVAVGGITPELPATSDEARQVASLFPHGLALLGDQASSTELVRRAPQAQVLHLAAHSGLSSDLNQTYIELSDGHFSLEQVYGLQLERGSKVVLSSCESALGQVAPGREVSSLASAFLASGASSVVATLWRVDDADSAEFFRRFYPLLLQKHSISAALRQARLECLADPNLRRPHCWGAYQLIGDPG